MAGHEPGPELLEREGERAELDAALAAAADGRGVVVLVEGAPGIGKTRLLDHVAAAAARLGVHASRARAHELEQRVPYAVVRGLLEPALAGFDAAPTSAGAIAARVMGAAAGGSGGADEAAGVVHGLYELTATLAARAPRALLVDDAQWADAASVRFLIYLSRVEALPVALIVAVRGSEGSGLVARLLDAAPLRWVRPAALSADAVGVVLRERLGAEAGPALRDACVRATGGTPLLVVELARALAAAPAEDEAAAVRRVGRLAPEGVTRSVSLRLAAVSEAARRLARATAILGDGTRLADASALAGLADRGATDRARAGHAAPRALMLRLRLWPALVLVAAAALLPAACGSEQHDQRGANTERATASATPYPTIDRANLVAGATYATRLFRPSITFTLPEGEWMATGADTADHLEMEPVVTDPVDDSTLAFHHMTRVFDPETGGEIPGDAVPGPTDFAAWLTHHPHLKATKPKPVQALGLKGVSIDVRTKSPQPRQYKDCGKVGEKCVVMFISSVEPVVYGARSFGRFYVLQQPDGKQLVVEQAVEPASAFNAQKPAFDAILRSATTGG